MSRWTKWAPPLLLAATSTFGAPRNGAAQEPDDLAGARPDRRAEVEAACEESRAAAASQAATLRWPSLFVSYGTLNAADFAAGGEPATRDLTTRFRAGLSFRLSGLVQASLLEARADAQCSRRRSELAAAPRAEATFDALVRAANEARAKSLEASLVSASAIVDEARKAYETMQLPADALDRILLKVDELRAVYRTARERAVAPVRDTTSLGPPSERASLREAEVEGQLRRATAFEVELRGGYDRIFGFEQAAPVFGLVSVSFNPGWFFQGEHESAVREARARGLAARRQRESRDAGAQRDELATITSLARQRAEELEALRRELDDRYTRARKAEGDAAKTYVADLTLTLAAIRAELAFQRALAGIAAPEVP